MKKFLSYLGISVGCILILAYLAFLFVLPNAVDLNKYIPELQKIVKEQANIDLYIDSPKISTNALLQAGIKTGPVSAKLPDGSTVFNSEGIKVRISLPNLLLLTVKVSCLEVKSPVINLEIINNEQFKVVRLVEDILNKNKDVKTVETEPAAFDVSMIKIKVPKTKISDYKVLIKDLKSSHRLTLQGDNLDLAYNNGKTAKVKTSAKLYSDDKTNINLNVDIDTFLPPVSERDTEDDPAEKIEIPFVNPVLTYRDYDLKSDADIKLKIRQNKYGKLIINGNCNIDKVTMNLSGLQLPYSSFKALFNGESVDLNTNIVVKRDEEINLAGKVSYDKNPDVNLNIFTDKIYFNDLITVTKAFLDTLHIKNNLASLKASGYWIARCNVKSDFKKLKSKGSIIARNGRIANGLTQLVFDKINMSLIFDGNELDIKDTSMLVNGNILSVKGKIDTDAYSDISIHSEKLPLPGLFLAFAPKDLRQAIALTSGDLSVDAKIQGVLNKLLASANIIVSDLTLNNSNIVVNNEKLVMGFVTDIKSIYGILLNKNFRLTLPQTNSTVVNPNLVVKLTSNKIDINPTVININNNSQIKLLGSFDEYSKHPIIDLIASGNLDARDLRQFAGYDAEPFIAASGSLPIKAKITGNDKKQEITVQVKSDSNNYLTPVDVEQMLGKQSILQAKIFNKKDGFRIRKTGFYTGIQSFSDDLESNLKGAKTIAEVSGTVVNTGVQPFINMIKVNLPEQLQCKFAAFGHSAFKLRGDLLIFGKAVSPIMKGNFRIFDMAIPEIYTFMDSLDLNLVDKNIDLDIRRLLLNGSDLNISLKTDINPHPVFTIWDLNVLSNSINLDTVVNVPEALSKYMAKPKSNADNSSTDIPILIRSGRINLRDVKTGNIVLNNTTGAISLRNNDFYLNHLDTAVFGGKVNGDIAVDLVDMVVDVKTHGEGLDTAKALLDSANMKDTLTGRLNFDTDLVLGVKNPDDLMKNINGAVTFTIFDGQLGPFGRLENMILAENIRESQFFQTALGSVINNLATIDTTHFAAMAGLIGFEDGIAHINPITTVGRVMSLHISGDFDLVKNTCDMKVRSKLGSAIASMLGPISQLNPINLVQVTPGLNVVMAKTFFLFCEQLTPEETAALPHLETDLDDKMATKFQIVLKGDVSKPLTLVKSFKWLALASEIEAAQGFVDSLPDPSIVEDAQNATIEEILKAQEEKAKEDAKLINRVKRFIKREGSD